MTDIDDLCEKYPKYESQITIESFLEVDGERIATSVLIQKELDFGSNYRVDKTKTSRKPVLPKKTPVEVSFEVCRTKQLKKKNKKKKDCCQDLCTSIPKPKKVSLLEKSIMSQEEYMAYLAMPHIKYQPPPPKINKPKKCEMSPCPPNFVKLAIPHKRRVLCNWNEYQDTLPVSVLLRFQEILHTDQNLELRDADYYYKQLEKTKKQSQRKKRRLKLKIKSERERGKFRWVEENVSSTAKVIIDYLREEPLFTLNFKQLLISDQILTMLDQKKVFKKPPRSTTNPCKKSFIEICDKVAVWMDTVTKFVDVQAVESEQDIPPITISSLAEEEEGEEEEEEEEEEMYGKIDEEMLGYEEMGEGGLEDILREMRQGGMEGKGRGRGRGKGRGRGRGRGRGKGEGEEEGEEYMGEGEMGVGGIGGEMEGEMDGEMDGGIDGRGSKKKKKDDYLYGEDGEEGLGGEYGTEGKMGIGGLGLDFLKDLIRIYEERTPDDYMTSEIEKVPGFTYFDILNKMKEITVDDEGPKKSKLEEAMIQWLKDVAPDEVNENTLKAIHEYACALLDYLKKQGYGEEDIDRLISQAEDAAAGMDKIKEEEEMIAAIAAEAEGTITAGYKEADDFLIGQGEEYGGMLGEEGEAEIIFEADKDATKGEGEYIFAHKPPKVYEHSPDAICCLSLKIWAVWLLEVTHNAHMWTKWMHEVIKKVREFASIVRGDVKGSDGKCKVLLKSDWRKFVRETEAKIIAWRQYSAHVKELSDSIIENFRDKKVYCCPKCLQDHLIKNVVVAHETLQALTEAMNCAQYWRRCLDGLVQTTSSLTSLEEQESSEESSETIEIEELSISSSGSEGDDDEDDDDEDGDDDGDGNIYCGSQSVYELEEIPRKDAPKKYD